MRNWIRLSIIAIAAAACLPRLLVSASPQPPTYQQFLSPASPQEMVSARKVDRVAWVDYAEGKRNAYTAAAPLFAPVRLTNFLKDDGIMMSAIKISDDGSTVVFLRGEAPNRDGWSPNPSADPNGPEHAIWAARTSGAGGAWRVVDATNPELAPDGSSLLFVKGGQIYRAKLTPVKPASEVDRGEKAFITEWGVQSDPKWSPDGRKIAFVSTRTDHSFIAVYDMATRAVTYMAPSVDFDTSPMWLPDSKHVAFIRRPGLPFGMQTQQGGGGIGLPNGPAAQTAATPAPGGRGGRGRGAAPAAAAANPPAAAPAAPAANNSPGMMRATFKGGYTLAIYKADVATGEAQETWHNQANDPIAANIGNAHLAGDFVVFPFATGGGRGGRGGRGRGGAPAAAAEETPAPQTPAAPADEWDRYYALNDDGFRGAAGAADHHRRADREPDLGGLFDRRQDLLLFDQRQGYRAAAHLGRAREWRHAGANHYGRGRRDFPGAAGFRQVPRYAFGQLEDAAIAGRVETGRRCTGGGRRAEDHLPDVPPGLSD